METKKSVLHYEDYVHRIEEVTAILYFMCVSGELEDYTQKAIRGIYGQLEEIKDGIEGLFDLATELQKEAKK